jgi:Mrp family chromosome partitioning ATPase
VLAIEGDLRRPDFEHALLLSGTRGLSEYLRGDAEFEQVLLPSRVPGLDVIVAGRPTLDSTELMSNGRISALLSSAFDRYDLVLLDGPPTEVLADAHLLGREVDSVLFCVRWGASDMRTVTKAVQELAAQGPRVLGLAVDRVIPRQLPVYAKYESYGLRHSPRVD